MTSLNPTRTAWLGTGLFFWPVCVIGVALVALAVLGPEAERRVALERQIASMQAEVDLLSRTRDQLTAAEKALRDDPLYQERIVRHELGITPPGEIRLPQPVSPATTGPADLAPPAPRVPDWLGIVASFADPNVRLLSMATGATLLLTGVLLSHPGLRTRRRPDTP